MHARCDQPADDVDRAATAPARRTRARAWGRTAIAAALAFAATPSAPRAAGAAPADPAGPPTLAAVDAAVAAGLATPADVAWPDGARGLGLGWGTTMLDAFEGPLWPDPTRWLYVADLGRGDGADGTRWAPSTCLPRAGARSLRANGATPAGPPACGAAYAGAFTAAAIPAADLSAPSDAPKAEPGWTPSRTRACWSAR